MAGLRSYLVSFCIVASISGCLAANVIVVNGTASHAIPQTLCKSSIVPFASAVLTCFSVGQMFEVCDGAGNLHWTIIVNSAYRISTYVSTTLIAYLLLTYL